MVSTSQNTVERLTGPTTRDTINMDDGFPERQSSLFLALPAELRNRIYGYYFQVVAEKYHSHPGSLRYPNTVQIGSIWRLINDLLVSRQFYSEAVHYFLKHSSASFPMLVQDLRPLARFINAPKPGHALYEAHLSVTILRARARYGPSNLHFRQIRRTIESIQTEAKETGALIHREQVKLEDRQSMRIEDGKSHFLEAKWSLRVEPCCPTARDGWVTSALSLTMRGHLGRFRCMRQLESVLEDVLRQT
ncbi:hypothetical protein EJ08DRAFT_262980 [Tothia fuscella]|uniref:Uncharacterized protein n=1 Tax=Tothia fuscella TaxID=1048955 RepID=A0A9P4NPW0_9PEZI|nr:hypothetical protein EJ08DRAFT_262980 [Tothia fuscella]